MSWYFVDANTSTSFAPGNPSSQTNDSAEETSAKVKALEDREAALAESESRYSESQKALENREAELAQNEKDYSSDKKALANRESSLAQREKEYSSKEKASADRESALAQKQKDYSSKEKALADREAALSQKEKDHSAEWDKKMKELQALQKSSAQRGKSGPGSVAGPPDCGYKHYKPPRKINRKVIGLVYEK
jgi:DNA repair exonuclease SbcCD ATPase subunit